METMHVDVAIIGAGSAGLNAVKEAEKHGKTWVIIDGGELGTTCARVGCMPSKLLIAAADAAHEVRRAHKFGVHIEGEVRIDAGEVFGRVRAERDRFVRFMREDILEFREKLIRGWAKFDPENQNRLLIQPQNMAVEAKAVVIATGSTPFVPPIFKDLEDHLMLNDDIFELEEVPEKLAVIGAGVIGIELGQALARLGSEVHVFDLSDHVGPFRDPAVQRVANEALGKEMDLHLSIEVNKASYNKESERFTIDWTTRQEESRTESFTHLFVAAGRRPNLDKLGLDAFDNLPRTDKGKLISDSRTMQMGNTSLFIAGDVSGHRPLLHEASDEGRIAGHNAARYPDVAASLRRTPLAIAFTHPQMAIIGKGYDQLDRDKTCIGEVSYENQGRARVMLINEGLVRLYADKKSCKLIGGEMFGPRVEHTAHLLAWMIQLDMRVQDILRLPFYHPVIEEGIRTGLRKLAKQLQITSQCPPEDFALSPGL